MLIICILGNKKPGWTGLFIFGYGSPQLFDLGFLVHHILAYNGIKLLDLHFFRHVFLVLGCGVEMASAS